MRGQGARPSQTATLYYLLPLSGGRYFTQSETRTVRAIALLSRAASAAAMRPTIACSPHWHATALSSGRAERFGSFRRPHQRTVASSNREYDHDANHRHVDRNDVGDGPRLGPRHYLAHSRYCGRHQISSLLTTRWRREAEKPSREFRLPSIIRPASQMREDAAERLSKVSRAWFSEARSPGNDVSQLLL